MAHSVKVSNNRPKTYITDISFFVGTIQHHFAVEHNFHEHPTIDLYNAVTSWLARTRSYSVHSFCEYISNKGVYRLICNPVKK